MPAQEPDNNFRDPVTGELASDADISVVIQGPITPMVAKCVQSVRKYLPDSKIILSTWENSDVSGLDFDEVIFNKDPNELGKKYPINLNRMLVSTLNGIKAVKTKYVLKIRTDFYLVGTSFKNLYFQKYPDAGKYKFMESRVVSYVWKVNPVRIFNVGDFYFFGRTSDVFNLFDIPLMSDEDMVWFETHKPIGSHFKFKNANRFIAEQYLWLTFLRKSGMNIPMLDKTDYAKEYEPLTEQTFAANLVFSTFAEFSIRSDKEYLLSFNTKNPKREYSFAEFAAFCRKFYDKNFVPEYSPKSPSVFSEIFSIMWSKFGMLIPGNKFKQFLRRTMAKLFVSVDIQK